MESTLIKTQAGYVPALEADRQAMEKIKHGEAIKIKWSRPRNSRFHRKYMALLQYAFDQWEPECDAAKNFDRFRKDIAISTGYYELVINIKNEARAEAKSISFAKMGEDEFSALYSKTIDFLIQKVIPKYEKKDIDHAVNEILRFA